MDYNYEKETLQAFREGRLIPEKDGKPWEKEDLETLQDMYYSGADLSRIAIELSRAEHGIVAKLLDMPNGTDPLGRRKKENAPVVPISVPGKNA